MRYLSLLPLVLVASCTSRPKPQLGIPPPQVPAVDSTDSVRYGEVVRVYHVGRYVDPHQPLAMHQQHPMYRVESSARWNLHPGQLLLATTDSLTPPQDAASLPAPVNDAIVAEMGRQREATVQVIQEAQRLAQSQQEFQRVIQQLQSVVTNQAQLGSRIADAERRLEDVGNELKRLTTPEIAPATNDVPVVEPNVLAPGR